MNKKLFKTAVMVLGAGAMLASCGNVRQPSAGCIVLDSTAWYFKYDLAEGQTIPTECTAALNLPGETVGVFKFLDPQKAGSTVLTLRPNGLAGRGARDSGDSKNQTAVGAMTETPDAEDFCTAAQFSEAKVAAAATATSAATNISYKFSNMQVYSAANAPGTQIRGDLEYTRDGCTAKFKVRGIWPATPCDPTADPAKDPASTCGEGSGINPDFKVVCDATLKLCVPDGPIPAIKQP